MIKTKDLLFLDIIQKEHGKRSKFYLKTKDMGLRFLRRKNLDLM